MSPELEAAIRAAEAAGRIQRRRYRRLHTVMTTLLEEILYDSPDKVPNKPIEVTREMVHQKLSRIVLNRDLSRYIL